MEKNLLEAVAIIQGQKGTYATLNKKGEWHFHLKRKLFSYMKDSEFAYIIKAVDSIPVLTDAVPVFAKRVTDKEVLVITKADLFENAKNILVEMTTLTSMSKYKTNYVAVSYIAMQLLELLSLGDLKVISDLIKAQWLAYPSDYSKLEK